MMKVSFLRFLSFFLFYVLLVVDFPEGNNSILWLKRNNYMIGPELFWAWLSFVWAGSGLCTSTGTVMVLNPCRSVLICRSVMCLRGWVALEVWIFHKGYLRPVLYESFGSERLFLQYAAQITWDLHYILTVGECLLYQWRRNAKKINRQHTNEEQYGRVLKTAFCK